MKEPVRLVDIAGIANVSRAVVAHVLLGTGGKNTRCNVETAEKIKRIARELGYRPNKTAQQLRGTKSNMLGVLALSTTSEVLASRLNHLEQEADAAGYRIIIGRVGNDSGKIIKYIDDFISRGVEGIIFLAAMPSDNKPIKECLENLYIPVICYSDLCKNTATFNIDRAFGIKLAVNHLIKEGYNRISLQVTTTTISTMKARIEGYLAALKENNIGKKYELIYSPEDFDYLDDISDSRWNRRAEDVVEYLVEKKGADAIILSDDYWAAFVIRYLVNSGRRVPEDIGIVGFDNSIVSKISFPTITSIDQCNHITAKHLVDYIKNFNINAHQTGLIFQTKPELIIRESSMRK